LHIIWNLQIQVSTNMSNVVKPWNFVPINLMIPQYYIGKDYHIID